MSAPTLTHWFHPSWCGDFRLERRDDTSCVLTVRDPTPGELERLGNFLVKARKKRWVAGAAIGIAPTGSTDLTIEAPVAEAGCVLAARNAPRGKRREELTCVRSVDDTFTVVVGEEATALAVAGKDPKDGKELPEEKKPKAAVTTRRPTLCCPVPIPGPDVRASQVLRAFCSAQQWADWLEHGWLVCRGNRSGHRYQIVHRHTPLARQRGKIGFDLEDQRIVHAYDWGVPPAEEVLGLKLALEHREHWVRNRSGYFGPGPRYHNPFMDAANQGLDGTVDAELVSTIGAYLQIGLVLSRTTLTPSPARRGTRRIVRTKSPVSS